MSLSALTNEQQWLHIEHSMGEQRAASLKPYLREKVISHNLQPSPAFSGLLPPSHRLAQARASARRCPSTCSRASASPPTPSCFRWCALTFEWPLMTFNDFHDLGYLDGIDETHSFPRACAPIFEWPLMRTDDLADLWDL